jgi:hypothetical protein
MHACASSQCTLCRTLQVRAPALAPFFLSVRFVSTRWRCSHPAALQDVILFSVMGTIGQARLVSHSQPCVFSNCAQLCPTWWITGDAYASTELYICVAKPLRLADQRDDNDNTKVLHDSAERHRIWPSCKAWPGTACCGAPMARLRSRLTNLLRKRWPAVCSFVFVTR